MGCPATNVMLKDPRFRQMKEDYADRHYSDDCLAQALVLCRKYRGYNSDWYPDTPGRKAWFTRFINFYMVYQQMAQTESDLSSDDVYNLYSTLYGIYTPEQLESRINMLANDFKTIVDSLENKDKSSRSRQDLISAQADGKRNGFKVIMDRVFSRYEQLYTDVDTQFENWKKKYPSATEAQKNAALKTIKYRAQEYKTLLANKERLAAMAAVKIGEDEGFIVTIKDFKVMLDEEDVLTEGEEGRESDGTDKNEGSKGERYGDFRTTKIMATLGPRVRRLISRMYKTDVNGKPIRDDLGNKQYIGGRQVASVLKRVLVNSSPETMMSDLESAAQYYPWMKGLIEELNKDKDKRATIFNNFKSAETTFVYMNYDNGSYTAKVANSRASGSALMREAGNNLRSGYVFGRYALTTGYGGLKSLEGGNGELGLKAIHERFNEIKSLIQSDEGLKHVKMVEGDEPLKASRREEIITFAKSELHDASHLNEAPKEAIRMWMDRHKSAIATLSELLRGMGFDVSEQDVRDIAMQEMSFKSYAFIAGWKNARKSEIGRNKLYQLVEWMDGVYNTAEQIYNKKDSQKTGQYLFNLADKSFARVNRCLALAQYKELEDRVVNEGKSLSTHNHVNLLHQTFDKLCNKDGRTEEIYLRDLNSDFLQYEGMAIGQGNRQQVFGWLRKFRDNENGMRDNFRIFDVASFNHVEYEKLSRAQKLTSSIVMYFDSGNMMKTDNYCAVEIPIQSDYSTAYNFVFAPKIKTGKLFSKYGSELEYAKDAEVVEELTNEVLAELERISAIEARINDDSRTKLDVYERQGLKFQIFPEFNTNDFRQGYTSFSDKISEANKVQDEELSKSLAEQAKDYVRTQVVQQLKKIVDRDIKTIEDAGVLTNPAMKRVDFGNGNYNSMYSKDGKTTDLSEAAKTKLQEFCLNVFYNRLQATKLLAGGLEQFDGLLDYEKRNMLSHATHTSLYTEATWKGEKVGKESQNVVYIEDDDAKSSFFDEISAALKQLLDDKLITKSQYDTMVKAYAKIKTTDGQGLRTLESYREVMIMADQWDDRHEAAYDRIIMGEPTKGDIDVFMQNIKPVLTGHEHVNAANGENQKPVRLTVLHKYSESVLLPLALAKYCKITKAVPLKALNMAQEKLKDQGKQIDMFLFHSGVKVGAHSVLQPFAKWRDIKAEFEGDTDEAARKRHGWNGEDLEERILKDANSIANSIVSEVPKKESTIHTIPFKYYGIAASTPAHAANDKIAWATQAEKVAWANIEKGKDTLNLRGNEVDAWEARELYNRIKTAQIIESYQELRKMFVNTDELEKAFQDELVSKAYSSRELAYALAHLKDGTFALPLFSPNVEHQVQELLSSIIKKRLTKPRTKGANILQESALGYDIEFSPFEENDSIPEDEKLGLVFEGEGDDRHFKYAEFSAPLTDDRLLPYADEYGGISAKRLEKLVRDGIIDEEILYFIAYRTPSDAEHSVIPGKIKYFTPNVVGATIKGPKEIMVTTGHDNDGDKLRCHFADFKIVWDEDKIHQEYERYLAGSSDSDMMRFIMGQQDYLWEKGGEKITEQEFTKRIKRMEREKEGNAFRKAKYIAYDYKKEPTENSQTARNNAKVELMFAQLSSKAGSRRFLIPGGCEESKIYAKSLSIVRSSASDENKQKIADKIIDQEAKKLMDKDKNLTKAQAIAKVDTGSIRNYVRKSEALYEQLIKRSDRELSDIMKEISGAESPFTLTHSADAFDYIMGGASMISVYATYNAAMQMLQRLDMSYEPKWTQNRDKRYEISFFGHKWGKLFDVRTHDIGNDRGMLASLGLARLLNAAVDNNKDPILGYLNQSREMAEMTFLMFAAGMTEEEIHLVMNQPAIIELVKRMRGREAEGLHSEAVKLAQELSRDKKDLGNLGEFIGVANVAEMKRSDFTKTLSKSIDDVMLSEDWDMIEDQISLLYTFAHLSTAATNLGDFVRLTRPDSESGAIGTSVADITTKVIELNKFRAKMERAKTEKGENDDSILRISGMRDVLKIREEFASENSKSGNLDAGYIAELLGSDLPEVVALNSMMIDSSLDMFRPYFPQAKLSWINVCAEIASDYKYHKIQEGTVNKIMEEMILFKLLQNDAFVQGDPQHEQKRIIVDVPKDLYDLKIRIDKAKKDPNSTDMVAKELIGNAFLEHLSTTSPENSDIAPRLMFTINGAPAEGTADLIRASWGSLLSSSDAKVRQLAIDLFKYNMYRSGFSYGMYEFAHFAPFSIIMSVPGYVKALREVLSSEWDDDYDIENFINQYYMNHWGDKKFLNFYKVSDISKHIVKLPEGVTGQIRLGYGDSNDENYVKTIDKIENSRYIILLTGEDGKDQTLYRVEKTDQPGVAVILVKAEKLGVRSYHNQVTLQYNPSDDYRLIKPVVPGNDSAWGILEKYEEEPYAQSDINAPGLEGEDAAYMASTEDLLSFMAASYGLTLRKSQIEKLDNEAAKNVEGNPETPQSPTEEEGGPVEFGYIPGLGDLSGIDFSAAMASPEEGGQMYSIARRTEEGKIVTEKVPATPKNVREARRQRTFVELNKRLREILREKGIGVGVLSDVEARMSLAGVTDFDTANVTAEGLLEMIRIAEGYVGEEALPEEFAHMALEMLGHDNPLVTRLLNAIGNSEAAMEEAYEGQYAEYKSRYGDENKEKLVLEAAGKLVAKHLLRQQEIKSPVKRLVYRVVEAIKNLLRKFRRDEVQNAIFDANQVASKIAREILSGKLVDQMDLENVKAKGQYQSVRGDLSDKKDILSKLLKNEVKRLNVLKRRLAYHNQKPGAQAVVKATQMQIDKLEAAITNHKTEDAIITYLNDSLLFIAEMDESLKKAIESGKGNSIAKKLNTVRDTLYSFAAAIDDINEAIADGEVADSVDMSSAIKDVSKVLRDLFIEYEKYAKLSFEEMLSSVYGKEGVTVTVGRQKGRKITIKEMARHADKDISLASRWFHAMADTSDYVLKAIDDVVRNAKMRARRRALNVRPRIEQAINDLVRETGSRDQSFMFEMRRYNGEDWCKGKADDGKLHKTGRYISEEDAKNLSKAQQKFYHTMMEIKKEADEFVPESMLSENKIIMVRKYTMDRFKDAEGAKGKSLEMWEGLKGRVMDMSDDIDFENYEVAVDFEGNRVDSLPLKFLFAGAKESYDDMTSDVATSLMAYAGMAFEYGEMNNVIGILENAKYMASERQVGQMTGTRVQRESIGSEEDDKYWYREAFTVKQAKTRIQEALEDFFQMHVYGHIQKNEGTFGRTRLSKRKVVDAVNAVTSYSQMAINLPQRIANVLTGSTQIALESIGNGAFSAGDIAWATKEYMKQSADRLAETGETDFDNKLSLWDEYFDVHQDNGRKNGKYGKNRVARAFNSGLLYAGLTMGEDLLASVTSLAIAKNIKVKINGEEATLWDAYTVKYRDPINKSGAYLVMKDNVTKMDGSAWTQEDEIAFSKKVAGTNFELQGIYNTDDKSAVQQYALGALIIMYRKWIAPALKRRYAGAQYNALKGEFEEGYHVTLWRLLHDSVMDAIDAVTEGESGASVWNLLEDFKALRSAILLNWNKMNEYEQSNIKRALGELATVTGLWAACALYGKLPPREYEDDERGKIMKWWDQTLFSQMLRLRTEIGSQAPTPMLVDEAMHILKSPFAAIGPLQNTINTFQLLLPSNYVTEIKSGRYRGHKKAYKYFRELPIISMFKKVDNFVDPSPLISYYKNDASY